MASARDVQKIIHRYARKAGSPRFTAENLEEFVRKFARRYLPQHPELEDLGGDQAREHLEAFLAQLEESGLVHVQRNEQSGAITSIYYSAFYSVEVQRWYSRMNEDKSLLFPGETDLEIQIPTDTLTTVDVATGLMQWIEGVAAETEDPLQILALRFPDGVDPILITVKVLREQALPLVLNKIRDYLRTDRNAAYMETKMRSLYPAREMLVRDEIETAHARPDAALQAIINPNEFQFHFWTQLASMIIKEYARKNEKLDIEHGFCQAAYMLGYFAVFHKGRAQKDHQREEARKILRTGLRKAPYVFQIQDLRAFTDDRGIPLERKVPAADINGWIEDMLRRPSESEISELVSINTPERNGLVIHSGEYIPLLQRQIKAAAPVLLRETTSMMVAAMNDEQNEAWLEEDEAFEALLRDRLETEFPLLAGLATFSTLFLVLDGQDVPAEQRDAMWAIIDRQKRTMKPWAEILQIDRRAVYKDARLQLPVWMIIPVVRGIVRLLRRMFSFDAPPRSPGKKEKNKAPSESRRGDSSREEKLRIFRETLEEMQKEYLGPAQTADQRLRQLRDSWNPILDPAARENLVEDVNSLCRDTLRRMRITRSMQAPERERIREQAKRIASNTAFDRIRRRDEFQTYLELYMITVLHRA